MIAFLIHTWFGLHQNMEIFGRHLSFSCPHLFQIAIILEWNIFIYILPSKQLSDVVKKKENLPSIDSRTPISQQFATFMIIFWRPLVFSTRKSNFSGNAVTSICSSKSIQGRRSTVEKTSRCKSKKGTSPNLLQTHYVLIHVFFNDTWAVFYRIPKLWTPFIFLKRK